MKLKVIWSPQAKKSLDSLIVFLEKKWPEKVIRNLLQQINSTILTISQRPLIYPYLSERKRVHKCVIKKKTLLLYRATATHIELVKFIDSRQNPSNYKF